MCFNWPMAAGLSLVGSAFATWVLKKYRNYPFAIGVYFFCAMEALQAVQYFYINECTSMMNKFLTVLGFLHICYQPYFCHLIAGSTVNSPKRLEQYKLIKKLDLIGGTILFLIFPLSYVFGHRDYQQCPSQDWLISNEVCTYMGNYHLAWSIPALNPSYFVPNSFFHDWLMFSPFLVIDGGWRGKLSGVFLFVAGPVLSAWITSNLHEQASIWCFYSVILIIISGLLGVCRPGGLSPKRAEKLAPAKKE